MESRNTNSNYFLEQEAPLDLSYNVAPYPIQFAQILREREIQAKKIVLLKKNAYFREQLISKSNTERNDNHQNNNNYGVLHIVEQKPMDANGIRCETQKTSQNFTEVKKTSFTSPYSSRKSECNINDQQRKFDSVNTFRTSTPNYSNKSTSATSACKPNDDLDRTLVISYKNNHWYYNDTDVPDEQKCTLYYKEAVEPPKTYSIKDLLFTVRMDIHTVEENRNTNNKY